ncbi:nucleoside triphosphate pyrophosphatase [Streptobacillus moniliformis]|uniref:nucleoside triphosphate pyrophosphatase n=1 Tax=Streptobacillus moniliformis TaxID=34105 RepID=UPI0007E3BB42|nr:Maf family protein [Streptobacillus moniliformis]
MKIYLASSSPRRKEILSMIINNFEIHVPKFDENEFNKKTNIKDPIELTLKLAEEKAVTAFNELKGIKDKLIISADTIVYFNKKIYGKGTNKEKSLKMLYELNNNVHEVITGVCIIYDDDIIKFTCKTKVYFANNSKETIEYYINNLSPFDKAGAYGIQDAGSILIEKIEGSYHNVMGLPIREVFNELRKIYEI